MANLYKSVYTCRDIVNKGKLLMRRDWILAQYSKTRSRDDFENDVLLQDDVIETGPAVS